MTPNDSLLDDLASLPKSSPSPRWERAVRVRCHEALQRRVAGQARATQRKRLVGWCFDACAGLGVCAFLALVLKEALRLAMGG